MSQIEAPQAEPSDGAGELELYGELAHTSLPDLLTRLAGERRSGVLNLSIRTGDGAIWLEQGRIADASFCQLEGKKALFRLLGETEGAYSFADSQVHDWLRRLEGDTESLVRDGLEALATARAKIGALSLDEDAFVRTGAERDTELESEAALFALLKTPRTLMDVLDAVPALDVEIIESLAALLAQGAVRRLPSGARRVAALEPDVLAGLLWRKQRPGFRGPARVGLAAPEQDLSTLQLTLSRLSCARLPNGPSPVPGCPRPLATLELSESVELELLGVPVEAGRVPIWGMFFPSLLSLLVLKASSTRALEAACEAVVVPWFDARERASSLEALEPTQLWALIRQCVEAAGE